VDAEEFDRPQHLLVRQRRDAHLESDSRKTSESFVYIQYLLRNRFSIANQQRARGPAQSVKLCPSGRGPAAFLPDLCEGVSVSRIKIVCSLLRGVSQEADCVKSDDEFLRRVAGAAPGFAVMFDQGPKSLGSPPIIATIRGSPSVPARTNDSGVPPTPTQIGRGFCSGTRINCLSSERSAMLPRPVNMCVVANLEEKTQFFSVVLVDVFSLLTSGTRTQAILREFISILSRVE
jgi:hypothetical protein